MDRTIDVVLAQAERQQKVRERRPCSVVLMNDDYTPMDFVVSVLEIFFGKDRISATRIMLDVHTKGRAVCGTYTEKEAKTKVDQVNHYARQNDHPLLCVMEEA